MVGQRSLARTRLAVDDQHAALSSTNILEEPLQHVGFSLAVREMRGSF